jgi:long-chain fatty acid transport protein
LKVLGLALPWWSFLMRGNLFLILILVFGAGDVHAAGFAVAEQGAAALGMANAVTGVPEAAGAAMFNPAALSVTAGLGISVSASAVMPFLTHTYTQDTASEFHVAAIPALSLDWTSTGPIRFGGVMGLNVPFGASLAWPKTWPGRFEVTSISLQVFEWSGNLLFGYFADDFSITIAAGPRFLRSAVELEKTIDAVDTEGFVQLGGAANAVSFQASLFASYRDLSLGLSFRPGTRLEYSGEADFSEIPIELTYAAHDQPVTTSVELPDRVAAGLSYDLGVGRVSADLEYFGWSSFKTFGIDFEDPNTPDVDEPRNWEDTFAARAGYEHRNFSVPLKLRAGFAWDPTPSPNNTLSPTLPDSDRVSFSLGASWDFGKKITADLAFSQVILLEKSSEGDEVLPGTYSGFAEVLSIGTRMTF